jgi:hypothetical protein
MTNLFDPEKNDNMDNKFALLTNVQCSEEKAKEIHKAIQKIFGPLYDYLH